MKPEQRTFLKIFGKYLHFLDQNGTMLIPSSFARRVVVNR